MNITKRARIRKAIERERKKEKNKLFKEIGIDALKKLGISLGVIVLIIMTFYTVEVIRFNKADGCKPGICAVKYDLDLENKIITYKGIGYTFVYKYSELETNGDLKAKCISGEFKLFGKKTIAAWIE